MAKKEEKTATVILEHANGAELVATLKSINEKLAELVDLARANSVNVNAIASVMPKPATHVAGFAVPSTERDKP